MWSEKSTVEGILDPVLEKYGVTFRVMKGFSSFTAVKQAAVDSIALAQRGKKFVVLYVGDWDPSGLFMSEADLPGRLARYGGIVQLVRIAVVKSDTADLPSFSAKRSDPRYRWFAERYGRRAWELDAMNPNDVRDRVEARIRSFIDFTLWKRASKVEKAEIASMQHFHQAWNDRLAGSR
jgi:hypothetical protein